MHDPKKAQAEKHYRVPGLSIRDDLANSNYRKNSLSKTFDVFAVLSQFFGPSLEKSVSRSENPSG